jgi:hypothetical protein
VVVVRVVEVGWYRTHMLWTQTAFHGYRPLQSESTIHPSRIGGATVEVEVTVLVGGATQMLRLLQICPFLQSALVMQPSLMGGAEEEGAGALLAGAATQMLC